MYPIPPNENLIERKICKHCSVSFPITDKDMEFYAKISPTFGGRRYTIPTPTLCPDCRQQRRLSFRNERKLYKRKCDATGKDIVSIYSPDKSYAVFSEQYWKSDSVDNRDCGFHYNKKESLFSQIQKLNNLVPKNSLYTGSGSENSEYNNFIGNMKDCYLVFDSMDSSSCYYGVKMSYSSDCIDCLNVFESTKCYGLIDGHKCFEVFHSQNCKESQNLYYCNNCIGCSNCINCTGLINKQFYINNAPVSVEEYASALKDIFLKESQQKKIATIHRHNHILASTNSSGDYLESCTNSTCCYDGVNLNSARYCYNAHGATDIGDLNSWGDRSSLIYEGMAVGTKTHGVISGVCCWGGCTNIYYSFFMSGCSDCFGCIGLRNKSYCILNKQYTKEEYEELVPQIINRMMADGEWGEFFPSTMSPFGYNETVAQEYFPLTKSEAVGSGRWNWSDYEAPFPKVEKVIPASLLPEDITQIPDDVLNWAIECEVTRKPFRIIRQELEFYRKHSLPIPRRHPDQRHLDRMALRNPRKLFERKCDKCGMDMITTYTPERSETVYCGACYEKEVLG